MRKLIVMSLLVGLLTFSGCALLESALYEQARDPLTSELEWVDVDATNGLPDDLKKEGFVVTVTTSEKVPGKAYEPYYGEEPSDIVKSTSGFLGMIPGWGALASSILTFVVGAGGGLIRGRRKLNGEKAKSEGFRLLSAELIQTLEDIKTGKLDTDEDGKVSIKEIGEYIKDRGLKSVEPAKLEELLRIIDGTLDTVNKVKNSD